MTTPELAGQNSAGYEYKVSKHGDRVVFKDVTLVLSLHDFTFNSFILLFVFPGSSRPSGDISLQAVRMRIGCVVSVY